LFGVLFYFTQKEILRYNKSKMSELLASIKFNLNEWEFVLIVFLLGVGVLLGLTLRRGRIFILLMGTYISFALINAIPLKKIFPGIFAREENFVALIVIFIIVIGLVYFVFSRSLLRSDAGKSTKLVFQSAVLGILLIGLVTSIAFSFFPKDLLKIFSQTAKDIFDSATARFLWLVLPIIFIGIFKGKRS